MLPLVRVGRKPARTKHDVPTHGIRMGIHVPRRLSGARVRMHAVRAIDGVLEVDVAGDRLVSSGAALEGVLVETESTHKKGRA